MSDSYKRENIAEIIKNSFGPKTVACTTAGEIGPTGYSCNSMTGLVLPENDFKSELIVIDDINQLTDDSVSVMKTEVSQIIKNHRKSLPDSQSFAIILADGL